MHRVNTLLQKLGELAEKGDKAGVIEIDLMMDYTKVIYADLLEQRNRAVFNGTLPDTTSRHTQPQAAPAPKPEPQQAPMPAAMQPPPPPPSQDPEPAPAVETTPPPAKKEEYEQEEKEPETPVQEPEEEEVEETPVEEPAEEQPPVKMTATKKLDYSSTLQKMIGINDKYLFISDLFNNDLEAYDYVLNEVNNMNNYSEAETWIKENPHSRYGWDNEDDTVETFYGVIKTFFISR